jgi:hypothetical protein
MNGLSSLEMVLDAETHNETIDLKTKINLLKRQIKVLKEIRRLISNQKIVKDCIPVPMWRKDGELVTIEINQAFEDFILAPLKIRANDYLGRNDFDSWPKENAEYFRAHDLKIINNNKGEWQRMPSAQRPGLFWNVYVCPFPSDCGTGVLGVAIPDEINKEIENLFIPLVHQHK